jgi:predicted DNA-binding protein (MmcQ/YjbR family)
MPDLDWIRKLCSSFPDATEDMPWEDTLCFKVRGRIFVFTALSQGRFPPITLKADPEQFHELLEIEGITPARYVGRYKWVTLADSNIVSAAELEILIRQSYELVAAKAPNPKKKAPGKKKKRTETKSNRRKRV